MRESIKKQQLNKKKVYKVNKKLVLIIGIAIVVLVAFVPIWIHLLDEAQNNEVVATVNGEKIINREFKQFLLNNRANTYSYFKQSYNADDSKDFWTKSFNGEIPIEKLRKETLDKLMRIKVQQILAKDNGVLKDTSYNVFLKNLEQENKARKQSVAKGQVIYGPQVYGESQYFNYVFSNMLIKLKEELSKKELEVSDKEVSYSYEADKDKNFKKEDLIKIQKLTLVLVDDKGNLDLTRKSDASARMKEIKERLEKNENIEYVAKAYSEGNLKVKLEEQTFGDDSSKNESNSETQLKQEALKLDVGKVSEVIDFGHFFVVFKVIEKKEMGHVEFDEAKDSIRSRIINKRYEEMVDKLVKDAKVEINWSNFNKIKGYSPN